MTGVPVGDLVHVADADVYKSGRLAGHLRRGVPGSPDTVEFAYDDDYLSDPAAPAVAFSLTRSATPVRSEGGSVPPFFAGLLPEGVRLQAISRAARTSLDDHLTLLLVVGADTIGDVAVVPAGSTPTDPAPMLQPAMSGDVDFAELFDRAISLDRAALDRVGLPGVQVKVSSVMMSAPVTTTAGPALLKLDPPEYAHLSANEHFFLSMAEDCGIPVPRHELLHDRNGRAALLVARFDRVPGVPPLRLPQEDACQVLGRYPAAKYRLSLHGAARALADAVADMGGSRPLALRRVLEIAAFSYLIGNGDLHGKNLSIGQDGGGLWGVTPGYDLLSTQPYLAFNDPMALALYGRANGLTRRWWLDAAERLGLPPRAIAASLDRMVAGAPPRLKQLADIGFPDDITERLAALLTERCRELASD